MIHTVQLSQSNHMSQTTVNPATQKLTVQQAYNLQTQSIPETPYRKETSRMTPEKRAEAQAFLRELQGK